MDLEQYIKELETRNAEKLAEAKEWLGPKWLLHHDNQVQRKNENAKVL